MNTLPAQEIKRRGISAVDARLEQGAVHVIKNNQPSYVVLSEEHYRELLEGYREAYVARVKASLKEVRAGRVRRFSSAAKLLADLDRPEVE